jgi:hypothetical protein
MEVWNGQAALGLGGQDGSLVIDLSKFSGINYGQDGAGTALVGGGTLSAPVAKSVSLTSLGNICRSEIGRPCARFERPRTGNGAWDVSFCWYRRTRWTWGVWVHEQDVGVDSR